MLLARHTELNDGPIEPGYYLLWESLNSALAASRKKKSQQSALIAASRKLEASQLERRQLEETLKKPRTRSQPLLFQARAPVLSDRANNTLRTVANN
jgi:hypothetical protein